MDIDPRGRTPNQNYKLITGLIVPRPIAWVTTLNMDDTVNLAPFSAFNLVTHKPPMVMLSIGTREGQQKDTSANILSRREFVINIASFEFVEPVHASSANLPYGESESARLDFRTSASRLLETPRLSDVAAALECKLRDCISYEDADSSVFIGDVLNFYVRDGLMRDVIRSTDARKRVELLHVDLVVALGELRTLPSAELLLSSR